MGLLTRAHFLTGPLIGVFPHSTQGNTLQRRGSSEINSLQGGFSTGVHWGGLYSGPQHVPSHRTPEMITRNVRTDRLLCKFSFAHSILFYNIFTYMLTLHLFKSVLTLHLFTGV